MVTIHNLNLASFYYNSQTPQKKLITLTIRLEYNHFCQGQRIQQQWDMITKAKNECISKQ